MFTFKHRTLKWGNLEIRLYCVTVMFITRLGSRITTSSKQTKTKFPYMLHPH